MQKTLDRTRASRCAIPGPWRWGAIGAVGPRSAEEGANLLHLDVSRRPAFVTARGVQPDGAIVDEGGEHIGAAVFRKRRLTAIGQLTGKQTSSSGIDRMYRV